VAPLIRAGLPKDNLGSIDPKLGRSVVAAVDRLKQAGRKNKLAPTGANSLKSASETANVIGTFVIPGPTHDGSAQVVTNEPEGPAGSQAEVIIAAWYRDRDVACPQLPVLFHETRAPPAGPRRRHRDNPPPAAGAQYLR